MKRLYPHHGLNLSIVFFFLMAGAATFLIGAVVVLIASCVAPERKIKADEYFKQCRTNDRGIVVCPEPKR